MDEISLTAEKLKQKIIDLINFNNLPPIVKYYIIKDVNAQIQNSYIEYINMLLQQEKEEKQGQN